MALVLLAFGAGAALLYFAHAVFVPIALSVLFALLLSAPVEALHRKGLPRVACATLILLLFVSFVGGGLDLLWDPAQQSLAAAPTTASVIQQKLSPAARIVQRIDSLTTRAGALTQGAVAAKTTVAASPESAGLLTQTREMLIAVMTVIILTLFILASGPPVLARMTAAFASEQRAAHVLEVIEAIRTEVGRYYATIALINLGLALATWGTMTLLGLPNPMLWGAVAGLLNFIPYVGSATTLIVLGIVAFVSFDGAGRAFAVMGTYLALATIEGQVVQPLFVGQRLDLNPVIVFLALWLSGWFWGIAGIMLAIPCLVALKVAAEHHPQGTSLVAFLSPNPKKRIKHRQHRQ